MKRRGFLRRLAGIPVAAAGLGAIEVPDEAPAPSRPLFVFDSEGYVIHPRTGRRVGYGSRNSREIRRVFWLDNSM